MSWKNIIQNKRDPNYSFTQWVPITYPGLCWEEEGFKEKKGKKKKIIILILYKLYYSLWGKIYKNNLLLLEIKYATSMSIKCAFWNKSTKLKSFKPDINL